jgi:divalent metal cation (Fe/Co/Zn/Cd) transporter
MPKCIVQLTVFPDNRRAADVRAGVQVEVITVAWMIVEAAIAIGAGVVARSVLLTAFGLDSVIELFTGGALLWRLTTEARGGTLERAERAENRAAWITGIGLALLCLYIVATAVFSIVSGAKPEGSPVGIGLAAAALLIMPWLVWRKRDIAARINSPALRADAACSLTCAYMAGVLLVGVALTTVFGLWWADGVAALALLYWIVPEAREALGAARSGRGGCLCGDAHCEGKS